jgi:hypothetical protein
MDFNIAFPTDATRLQFSAIIGPSAAQAGTYTETSSTCGNIYVCAILPASTSVTCGSYSGDVCPSGCTGNGTTCVPIEPASCWQANGVSCGGGASALGGSWRLTLSSVDPYTPSSNVDTSGYELWVAHGSLDATLVKVDDSGAVATPTDTATLSLSF